MFNKLFFETVASLEWWFSFCRLGYGQEQPDTESKRIEYHEPLESYPEDEGIDVVKLVVNLVLITLIIAFAIVDVWAVYELVKNIIRVFIWGCEFAW